MLDQLLMVFGLDQSEVDIVSQGSETVENPFLRSYEGTPSYEQDPRDLYEEGVEYRTALTYEMFDRQDTPEGWERVARFNHSGETQCRCEGHADCPLCEGEGLVDIGDGWGETVYRRDRAPFTGPGVYNLHTDESVPVEVRVVLVQSSVDYSEHIGGDVYVPDYDDGYWCRRETKDSEWIGPFISGRTSLMEALG